jgi:hypothetical protein
MRTRARLAAIVTGLACAAGAAYAAGGPGAVYNDFAADGVLSCNHSRADLVAVLRSGSLNQYGDPLTLARLKLAVRKQLADGCPRGGRARGETGVTGEQGGTTGRGSSGHARHRRTNPAPPASATRSRGQSSNGDNGAFVARAGLIAGLLVAALAFGGWLTKRALAARD